VPESFKVLVKELQALGLNVELLKTGQNGESDLQKTPSDDAKETVRK
jgi:hypothetical protein